MQKYLFKDKEDLYVIAEMACAHNGDPQAARDLIDFAHQARADAIQLQFFHTDEIVTPCHCAYSTLKKIEFSHQTWESLCQYARVKDIAIFACTYDVESVVLAKNLKVDGIKINSADLSNPDLLQEVAATQIPFTLGTGASPLEEITQAVDFLHKLNCQDFVLMHGVQNFPTCIEDLHIGRLDALKGAFDLPLGYQDHMDAEDPFCHMVDLIAIGAGARVIEKHITLDRAQKGVDYQSALEPSEFKLFVQRLRCAQKALGKRTFLPLSESDLKYRQFQKKSIVAKRDIQKGDVVSPQDIVFLRSSGDPGLPPSEEKCILNKVVKNKIKAFSKICKEDLHMQKEPVLNEG